MRPTAEETQQARMGLVQFFAEFDAHPSRNPRVPWTITHDEIERVRILYAATESRADEEIYNLAKPDVDHHEDSYVSGWFDAARHFFGPVKP